MVLHLSCVQTSNYSEGFGNGSTALYCDQVLPSVALFGSDHDSGPPANPLLALDLENLHGHGLQDTSDSLRIDLSNCYAQYAHMMATQGRFDVGQRSQPDCPMGYVDLEMLAG